MSDQPHPPPPPPASPPGQPAAGQVWQAPGQPWQAPRYGGAEAYAHVPGQGPWGPLAGWGSRVGAMLVDTLVQLIGMAPYVIGLVLFVAGTPDTSSRYDSMTGTLDGATTDGGNVGLMVAGAVLVLVGLAALIGIQVWNRCFKQGRTGQSIGKRVLGLKLVDERTGQPIGAGMAFVRDLAHVLDGLFYIGYLWPLWDDKRQTFADKVLSTVVVEVPRG